MQPYLKGFFIAEDQRSPREGFNVIAEMPGLQVEASTKLETSEDPSAGKFVSVLGSCVDTFSREGSVASRLLEALKAGESSFFRELPHLAGRYVILFGSREDFSLVGDATGMMPVFYREGGGLVGSHARLLAELSETENERYDLPFSSAFPGNFTPYKGVKILPPNFTLNFRTGKLTRYWPNAPLAKLSTESVAREVFEMSKLAFENLVTARPFKMALTAGLDSRVALSVAMGAGYKPEMFTYGSGAGTEVDRNLAASLCEGLGLKHTVLPQQLPGPRLKEALEKAHYWDHHWSAVPTLRKWLGAGDTAVFTTNILEIGQRFYSRRKWANEIEAPASVSGLSVAYMRTLSRTAKKEVESYGRNRYREQVESMFGRFLDVMGGFSGYLDPFDEYYWAHRMGMWHGPSSVEKHFYGEPLNPFNNTAMIEKFLSVSVEDQLDGSVFYRMISIGAPQLLDYPVNPQSWP